MELIVKARGDCSCTLQHVVPGVPAHIEGPFGGFKPNSAPQVWIGGGIGITPFIPLLEATRNSTQPIDVYYVTRTDADHVLLPRLNEAARENPSIIIHPVSIQDDTAELISFVSDRTPDFKDRSFLLSGAPQMVRDLESRLITLGIPSSRIKHESFGIL